MGVLSIELQRETGLRDAGACTLWLRIVPECGVNPVRMCLLSGFIGAGMAVADVSTRPSSPASEGNHFPQGVFVARGQADAELFFQKGVAQFAA